MQVGLSIVAAGWIEWAGPIVVFILYTIGQLVMNQGKKPVPQQRPQKPRPAVPQQQPRTLEEKLRTEVEEFLRQVQGEKPKQPEAPQRPVVVQRPLVVKAEKPVEVAIALEPERVSVQEHVARHISTADVVQHASALGVEVSQTDERFQSQLQDKFQHQLGALEPRQQQVRTESTRRRTAAAAEIANLLKSPQGMRQVIVASEILRRPEI